ncbi:MAG: hypothetical protein HC922_07590 [Leptolyngbyaceae cyanobacterium SM2_3_12]|nr:hypothetical protein [Leptolyngbyaceae cyanobacterium SM2_3_12]
MRVDNLRQGDVLAAVTGEPNTLAMAGAGAAGGTMTIPLPDVAKSKPRGLGQGVQNSNEPVSPGGADRGSADFTAAPAGMVV